MMKMRAYRFPDEVLLEHGSTVAGFLHEDISFFSVFDPSLNQKKLEELEDLITTAMREGTDATKVAVVGDYTEKVKFEMENCRSLFHQLSYWVERAFPQSPAIQKQFGKGQFSRVSRSQPRLIEFMRELTESVKLYHEHLIIAGAPEEFLEGVGQQAFSLVIANLAQGQSKSSRMIDTETRIERLTEIWSILRSFDQVADFVFTDEPAKRKLYRVPARKQPKLKTDSEEGVAIWA